MRQKKADGRQPYFACRRCGHQSNVGSWYGSSPVGASVILSRRIAMSGASTSDAPNEVT